MAKDLTKVEPSLRKVLEMDADSQSAAQTLPIIQKLVPLFKEAGTLAEVGLAALIYSLAKTKVLTEDGEVKAKWEVASLVEGQPFSRTWADFCYSHLGVDPTMASNYKRIWEVFHVNLGYDLDDLQAAGIHKLRLATATVDWLYPQIDLPLVEALFGNPHRCGHCGFEPDRDVSFCPSCDQEFESTPPGSIAAVALRVKQLRDKPEGVGDLKVLGDLQPIIQDSVIVGWQLSPQCWLETEEEDASYIPTWSIDIIPDDSPKDTLGVKERHAAQFAAWLRRHFG